MGLLLYSLAHTVEGKMIDSREAIGLQDTVNAILRMACAERQKIGGAVNWADLRCTDVQVSAINGLVTVTVEEAAPEASLCIYVHEELKKRGHDVIVRTEW